MCHCLILTIALLASPIVLVSILATTISLLKSKRYKLFSSLAVIGAGCVLMSSHWFRTLMAHEAFYIAFAVLLLAPTAVYQIRLLRANVDTIRADVDSGYRFGLLTILAGLNLSLIEHMLEFYTVYSVCFSISICILPKLELLYAIQILNILTLACFIWLLINPLPEPFSVMARILINEHGRVDFSGRKYRHFQYTKMYETYIFNKFQSGLNKTRGLLYNGFVKFSQKKDIISYLSHMTKQYTKELEILDKQPLFNRKTFYICDLQSNKMVFFCLFLITFSTNYLTLFCGHYTRLLSFQSMGSEMIDPLYFLLTTFATVGYGDVVQSSEIDKIICVSLLIQLILFVFVIVNIMNDQSQIALEKFNNPSKQILHFLLAEADLLIHQLETGIFDRELDEKIDKFRLHPSGIGLFLSVYKRTRDRSDNYSI